MPASAIDSPFQVTADNLRIVGPRMPGHRIVEPPYVRGEVSSCRIGRASAWNPRWPLRDQGRTEDGNVRRRAWLEMHRDDVHVLSWFPALLGSAPRGGIRIRRP